jgi:hypothetical protein
MIMSKFLKQKWDSFKLWVNDMIAITYHFFGNDIYMIVYHFLGHDIDMISK